MNVLIAVRKSSRQHSRDWPGDRGGAASWGLDADLREVDQIVDMDGYDAAILGKARSTWEAGFRRHAASWNTSRRKLASIPVWLFSSGPLGTDDPQPHGDPQRVLELVQATGAREHHIFVGKLDSHSLGLGERLIARVVHAPQGDFRDWEAIRGWAAAIAASLQGRSWFALDSVSTPGAVAHAHVAAVRAGAGACPLSARAAGSV